MRSPVALLLAFSSVFTLFPHLLAAQTIITCSSDNGKRRYCPANTRGGVKLGRQRSGSPCKLNYSWGFDQRGIWVDRGCRADFILGRVSAAPVPPPRPPVAQPLIITCSSNNMSRNYCPANTTRGVTLRRQLSGSVCRQGVTWGYDKRGIWVDRGCRAEFVVR
ncbi:MAG: DUF3011 domain-containing protein [Bryobacteraceae bacterium]